MIPSVNFTIANNGLGNQSPSPAGTICVFGTCSGGTAATVMGPYANTQSIVNDNGYGPGPELVAYLVAAGIPTLFVKMPTATPGAASSVTHVGTGAASVTVSGTPRDDYTVVVTMTRSGTARSDPEPAFTVSLDGGLTTLSGGSDVRVPASGAYLIGNTGITITFSAASCVAGDTYSFTTTAPQWTGSDLTAAANALRDSSTKQAEIGYVVGPMSSTDFGTLATARAGFLTKKKPIDFIVESADFGSNTEAQWMTAIENDYVTAADDGIVVAAGPTLVASVITGAQQRRCGCGWAGVRRAGLVKQGRDLAAVADGPLTGITTVFHDEFVTPGLDADRFMTLTSIPGKNGFFITNPNIMSTPGSDFDLLQLGRVMNEAVRRTYGFFVNQLSSGVRITTTGDHAGKILEKDALTLEHGNDAILQDALVNTGNITAVKTTVSRDDLILSTKTVTVTVAIVPLGYIKTINITMTFENPALQIAA